MYNSKILTDYLNFITIAISYRMHSMGISFDTLCTRIY